MIDTDKYEGHTEGEWRVEQSGINRVMVYTDDEGFSYNVSNRNLVADAPLLLAEIKRLRMIVARLEDARIESASMYDRPKLFHAVREIYEQRLQDIYQEKREEE
jgi:hypothetical protein